MHIVTHPTWSHMLLIVCSIAFIWWHGSSHLILVSLQFNDDNDFRWIFIATNCFFTSGFFFKSVKTIVHIETNNFLFCYFLRSSYFSTECLSCSIRRVFLVWNRFSLLCLLFDHTCVYMYIILDRFVIAGFVLLSV